jgi:AcrR family transcriptional regulator
MPRKPATEEQREASRRQLQAAASSLYADVGAGGVSARAIADRAGVSVGTIYSYFGSLQGLMQSLWMQPLERINVRLTTIARTVADPVDRIRKLLEAYVEVATRAPDLFRGAFLFVRPESLEKPTREHPDTAVFFALMKAAIAEGQAEGRLRAGDPGRLAQLAWAAVHGSLALPVNFDRLDLETGQMIAAAMIPVIIDSLAPSGSAGSGVLV